MDRLDDLGVVDPLEVDRGDAEVAVAKLASMPSKRSDAELVDAAARRERLPRARPISSRLRQPGDLERVV